METTTLKGFIQYKMQKCSFCRGEHPTENARTAHFTLKESIERQGHQAREVEITIGVGTERCVCVQATEY